MNKIEHALKLAKDCTFADEMTEGGKEVLRMKIDEALEELVKILPISGVSERKIVRCEDPMVCLRGCSVHKQTCEHPIYER